jgi:hypothetical protein
MSRARSKTFTVANSDMPGYIIALVSTCLPDMCVVDNHRLCVQHIITAQTALGSSDRMILSVINYVMAGEF